MIPELNQSGVLPPFNTASGVTKFATMSPYPSSIKEFVERYAYSDERKEIIQGFLKYRNELRTQGFTEGFQWIDGSFVEDVESNQNRPPNDIDIVTFAHRPEDVGNDQDWKDFVDSNINLFDRKIAKEQYKCDSYFVDMSMPAENIIDYTKYYFGLFSHQRETFLWKGMIKIPLAIHDEEILFKLELEVKNAKKT